MSVAERLREAENRLDKSEGERRKLAVGLERLCDFMGVNFGMIFKSETLFDMDEFEFKEEITKSKERLPSIALVDGGITEEKKKVADIHE